MPRPFGRFVRNPTDFRLDVGVQRVEVGGKRTTHPVGHGDIGKVRINAARNIRVKPDDPVYQEADIRQGFRIDVVRNDFPRLTVLERHYGFVHQGCGDVIVKERFLVSWCHHLLIWRSGGIVDDV